MPFMECVPYNKNNTEMNKELKLYRIKERLEDSKNKLASTDIYVPSVWTKPFSRPEYSLVNAGKYYAGTVSAILKKSKSGVKYGRSLSTINREKGPWTPKAVIYNVFTRLTTAFDHDGNNAIGSAQIDMTVNEKGIRDCGTFLKTIAILPYIKSLGANTLYLLPVNKIGMDNRAGNLGSPYATADLESFDQRLADPLLGDMSVEDQFAALVEAAHIMGIRVVTEFAMRTAALDCSKAKKHPDWFYWIYRENIANYGSPAFAESELEEIKKVPSGIGKYIAPQQEYRDMFAAPPKPSDVKKDGNKYHALSPDGEIVIPGAFADWPPDDVQPAWRDVTYFRMYDPGKKHKVDDDDFNYIAYNTIRYYDPHLAKKKNAKTELWEYLSGIIPSYQEKYGIDGSMIDMGHAIPKQLIKEIVKRARKNDPSFAFFEENFYPTPESRKAGYDASLGFGWECSYETIGRMAGYTASEKPMPVFGTLETHNTPRAASRGGAGFSKLGYGFFSFLPSVLPFIHGGFELLETMPVNTGVGFTADQSEFYRKLPLPLFNTGAYNWLAEDNITGYISAINTFRRENEKLVCTTAKGSFDMPHTESPEGKIISYRRVNTKNPYEQIVVIANTDPVNKRKFYMNVPYSGHRKAKDILSGTVHSFVSDWLSYDMGPGQLIVLKLSPENNE